MIRQYELIDKVLAYNPKANVALLNRAYVYSMKAHGNQKRASGQPYLVHPLEVAAILAELRLDDASIAVGLLHDTLEDTLSSYEEIRDLFGDEIAKLTEGVTKLSRISFNSKSVEQAENFRKLLLAMSEDIRVLLIKLADRLHNMRTMEHISKEEKRRRKAQETLEIFAPLADRIGLHSVKNELEELSFQILEPEEYNRLHTLMVEWREQDNLVERVIEVLQDEMTAAGMETQIFGREKALYSICKKMRRKNLTFEQLTDIVAYRIIVSSKRRCYEVLGLMHDLYKAVPGRFKDYISAPKPNGYQSLHTSVIGPFGNRMEVQIRTQEMHDIAESGVAAHWIYKDEKSGKWSEGQQYKWLRQLVEHLQGTEDPEEFYEHAKLELFSDNVFVFTPSGDLVSLPQGSTPLDFAYSIHSDIGHQCQTVRVGGRAVPLRTRLRNGDIVEIVTNKNQRPSPGWREFVVTARAKAAINRYLRSQEKDEKLKLGKDILEKAAKREQLTVTEKDLQKNLKAWPVENVDDVFVAMAQGRLFPRQIFEVLYPERAEAIAQEKAEPTGFTKTSKADDTAIAIDGLTSGMSIYFAKCCSPIPGEDIVGIITTGRGVTVHAKHCRNLEALSDQPDRWLSLRWNEHAQSGEGSYTTRIRIIAYHQPGTLSSISTSVFNADGNITDLSIENRNGETYTIRCELEVHNVQHLNSMISQLNALKVVANVEKIYG